MNKRQKQGIINFPSFKKLGLLFILLSVGSHLNLWSQSKTIDSLKHAIAQIEDDTLKIDLYNTICLEYIYRHPDSALFYIDSLKYIGKQYHNDRALAIANNRKGVYDMVTGDYAGAITELSKAQVYYSTTNDTASLAGVYNNLGSNDFYMKDYHSSLSNYKKGLSQLDRFKNPEIYSVFVANLSEVYREMDQVDSAAIYAEQSIEMAERLKDDRKLSIAYFNMGAARFKMHSYPEALSYLNQALGYDRIPIQYSLLAKIYKVGSLVALDRLGEAKVQLEGLEERALKAQDRVVLMQLYQVKNKFYKNNGQFEEALHYAEMYQAISEEIHNVEQTQIRENLKIKFDISQKDNENSLLRREAELNQFKLINQRNLIWGVGVFIFVLLILLLVLSRMYEVNKKANLRLRSKHNVLNRDHKNLEKINTQKNNLFSIVAHDVKSPLGAIMTSINMLKDNINDFSEQELNLLTSELSRQAESLYDLLEGALTWTKSQMGGYKFYRKSHNVHSVLKEITDLEKTRVLKKQIEIIDEIPVDFDVWVDAQVLKVVMRNLINNAIKFTAPGGTIKFASDKNDEESRISIIDNGLGISQEKIDHIFIKRQRYTRKGTGDEEGNGIGLILCSEIAIAMGGGIEVKSTVGRGSTFTLILPNQKAK
ncbi:MAG TPA: sensor histidine kinase [Leeuwenhoekiella sp.]|nr:sensor histidine kinase [Leeuwenhoekiella sp.]